MVEEELKKRFRALVDSIRDEFDQDLHLVDRQNTKRILEYDRGGIKWQDYIRPKFEKFFYQRHETIRDLAEYEECIDFAIENYDVVSKYHDNRRGLGEILIYFIIDVFAENNQNLYSLTTILKEFIENMRVIFLPQSFLFEVWCRFMA